jgi:hypothetical protein
VNWKLILALCVAGPLMGALMVMGVFPEGTDRYAWFVIVGVNAVVVARKEPERALAHGALIGFVNGAVATLVQAVFLDTLVANNPYIVEKFANQPAGFDLQYFIYMLVPFVGIAGGAMTGLLSMLAARALASRRRKQPPGNRETAP